MSLQGDIIAEEVNDDESVEAILGDDCHDFVLIDEDGVLTIQNIGANFQVTYFVFFFNQICNNAILMNFVDHL